MFPSHQMVVQKSSGTRLKYYWETLPTIRVSYGPQTCIALPKLFRLSAGTVCHPIVPPTSRNSPFFNRHVLSPLANLSSFWTNPQQPAAPFHLRRLVNIIAASCHNSSIPVLRPDIPPATYSLRLLPSPLPLSSSPHPPPRSLSPLSRPRLHVRR